MAQINPDFATEIKEFGIGDFEACYNCGNCTAVCSLSTEDFSFPREMIRFSVLGLDDEIKQSLKPWQCYYCGECTETCPRQANPGELMMTLRRWLISKYDWTKLSGLLFKSLTASIIAFFLVAFLVITVAASENFNLETLMHIGHNFEMFAILGVFLVILTPNIIRMWYYTVLKPKVKSPLSLYIKSFKDLIVHMVTQKRAKDCDDNKFRWFEHLILAIGYITLLFTTVFLDWFSTENIFIIWFGYIVSAIVFIVTFDFVLDRIKKKKEVSKTSHPSDWFFVIWLFLMSFTAFVVRIFVDTNLLENNIWLYLVHIIVLAQWALIIVPFGKWTHFLYRSFAMYFESIVLRANKIK